MKKLFFLIMINNMNMYALNNHNLSSKNVTGCFIFAKTNIERRSKKNILVDLELS